MLEIQGLLAGFLHKTRLASHRRKRSVADYMLCVSTCMLDDFRTSPVANRKYGSQHILQTTVKSVANVICSKALVWLLQDNQFSTDEVRSKVVRYFPFSVTITRLVKAFGKFNPVCPFDLAVTSLNV